MKIGVTGMTGRVGKLIISELQTDAPNGLELACALARHESGVSYNFPVYAMDKLYDFIDACDVIIDFTKPDLTTLLADHVAQKQKALVTGTTGLNDDQENELKKAADKAPIVYAANMSLGVNLLLSLVNKAAATLGPDWDIEISETHHRYKADAPSGTALALGHAAASGRGSELEDLADNPRHGITGERESGKIGFAVQRGGDVVGEHCVTLYGEGERIKLSHIASDRRLFARGALKAAKWVHEQPPGLYSMQDVLNL